jgi:DNA primase
MWNQRQQNGSINLSMLGESFSPEEISHISGILQKPVSLKTAQQALDDYIRIILEEAQKRNAASEDPLAAATEKYKRKNNGGKQYG